MMLYLAFLWPSSPDKMARYHARKKELGFVFELLKVAHLDG